MFKVSDFDKQVYKTGDVAKILGVTNKTIQNYDKEGKLKVGRNPGNRRVIVRDDLHNPLILKEVGSGLNDNRKQLQKLLEMVCQGKVRNVYVTFKDRLTRFGFRYLETVFAANGTSIIVVRDEKEEKTVQEETDGFYS